MISCAIFQLALFEHMGQWTSVVYVKTYVDLQQLQLHIAYHFSYTKGIHSDTLPTAKYYTSSNMRQ